MFSNGFVYMKHPSPIATLELESLCFGFAHFRVKKWTTFILKPSTTGNTNGLVKKDISSKRKCLARLITSMNHVNTFTSQGLLVPWQRSDITT